MNIKIPFVFLLVAFSTSTLLAADSKPDSFAPMPWRLVDIWWDIGRDIPFESYSTDVTIGDDVPADVSLYISPIGLGHLNKTAFYSGIQTRADAGTKRDPGIHEIGRGLLMSMRGERSLDAIRTSVGGFCQSSGHEGDFVSVRCRYEWKYAGNLKVNGQAVEKPAARAVYPKGVPDYADAAGKDESVVIRVGERVENRTAREVELIEK